MAATQSMPFGAELDGRFMKSPQMEPFQQSQELTYVCDQKFEKNRLLTFEYWPTTAPIEKGRLAKMGFVYLGVGDTVKCYCCGVLLSNWREGDSVHQRHQRAAPHCSFVKGESDNVPDINMRRAPLPSPEPMDHLIGAMANGHSLTPQLCVSSNGHFSRLGQGRGVMPSSLVDENYKNEAFRLTTFKAWPHPRIRAEKLAKAGFYFLREGDKVQCAFCKGIVKDWEPTDDPMMEHRSHFPFCGFVQGKDVGNIPSEKRTWFSRQVGSDVAGNMEPVQMYMTSSARRSPHSQLGNMQVNMVRGPCFTSHVSEDMRNSSFAHVRSTMPVSVDSLVEAGFFYLGTGDSTKCFYCGGGLCNWVPEDDPWKEHARWFPHCDFVRLTKGQSFIDQCIRERPPVNDEELEESGEVDLSQFRTVRDMAKQVDEEMQTPLVRSFLEAEVFSYQALQAAVVRQLEETGTGFDSEYDLCQAVWHLQLQEENTTATQSGGTSIGGEIMEDLPIMGVGTNVTNGTNSENSTEPQAETTIAVEEIAPTPAPEVKSIKCDENGKKPSGREGPLCKICMDKEANMAFIPCGHLLACVACSLTCKKCPMCRNTVQSVNRIYVC